MTKNLELGRFEEIRKGVPLKFVISTVPEELAEDVINHMIAYFLKREPMTAYVKLYDDKVSLNSLKCLWKNAIAEGTALVALEDTEDNRTNIIGANMTIVASNVNTNEKYEGKTFGDVLNALARVTNKGDVFGKYGVDRYLSAYGLSVHPDYHGYQVGLRLLQCRQPLCKAIGVSVSATVFTAKISQHIAAKVGFETLAQQDYMTYEHNGERVFANLEGDMKLMALKYTY